MKQLLFFLFFLGHTIFLMGQATIEYIKPWKLKGNLSCSYKLKYTALQRQQFYPFVIADSIKMVTFRYHRNNLPIKGERLIIDSIVEMITLTKKDIDEVTDILYNNFYKKKPNYGSLAQCFFPRNAILFYDSNGNLREYILICFHCENSKKSSDKVQLGDACSEKIDKLRLFFIGKGLTYGTDKNAELYNDEESDEGIISKKTNL